MSNKKSGTDFEKEFCKLAAKEGFWATMLNPDKEGQPADIIISKNNTPALIDAKDCEHDNFSFDRIEENQWLAMERWLSKGNKHALFALNTSHGVWLIHFESIRILKNNEFNSLNCQQIKKMCISFKKWVEIFNENYNK